MRSPLHISFGGRRTGATTVDVKIIDQLDKVTKAEEKATFENVRQAAYSIRKDAVSTIKRKPRKSQAASPAGQPPLTRGTRGKNLRSAIYVGADMSDKQFASALVGPRASFVGIAGEVHELGKSRGGTDFPERPFMRPALLRAVPRLPQQWSGTIGES
jgi:hypothetical protein